VTITATVEVSPTATFTVTPSVETPVATVTPTVEMSPTETAAP
jgi:hypothetical protein